MIKHKVEAGVGCSSKQSPSLHARAVPRTALTRGLKLGAVSGLHVSGCEPSAHGVATGVLLPEPLSGRSWDAVSSHSSSLVGAFVLCSLWKAAMFRQLNLELPCDLAIPL